MAARRKKTVIMPVGSLTGRVRELNRWRDGFNPLRGLTIRRATYLLESYALGEFTDLMWTFGHPSLGIETLDPDISALITRRTAAIQKLDWNVKTMSPETSGFDQVLADEQAARLREQYEGIDNLPEAIAHFCLSNFRGFSLSEKWETTDGDVYHLELVDHWNVVRNGANGQWKYNPEARSASFFGLPGEPLPEEQFLIRESKRPINMFGLLKYVRGNLSEKNWDAFIEIYGVPGGVVIMPPSVPANKEAEYQASAEQIAKGGSGALPHGSDYKTNDSPRGNQPFKDRLAHLSEKVVLLGTGGKLTMLAAPTGIGSGPSEEQADVFDDIAQAEALEISAIFQRGIDAPLLDRLWPGRPALAYFEICAREETDTTAVVADVESLSRAGYQVSPDQITEKTAYEVTIKPQAPAFPSPIVNRAAVPDALGELLGVDGSWFGEARAEVAALEKALRDPGVTIDAIASALERVAAKLPELLTADSVRPIAKRMEAIYGAGALEGVRRGLRKKAEVS